MNPVRAAINGALRGYDPERIVSELVGTERFQRSSYRHDDGKKYHVSALFDWAQENYPLQELPIDLVAHTFTKGKLSDERDGTPAFTLRAQESLLDYPILVGIDHKGPDVIDGRHRLWKAIKEGRTTIRGYLVDFDLLPPSALV